MALERWLADGYEFTEGAVRQVEYRSGQDVAGGLVGPNTPVPNRRGQVWRRKQLGPGSFTLNLWLAGTTRQDVQGFYDLLLQATVHSDRLVKWERYMPDGTIRYCLGEVVQAVEPQHAGQRLMRIGLEVQVPAGIWLSSTSTTASTAAGATLPKSLVLTNQAGSTAPLDELSYTVVGPIAAGAVLVDRTNGYDGDRLTYNKALLAGHTVTFNSETFSFASGGGHAVDVGLATPTGPRLMTLATARPGLTPTVELRGTGGGAGTQLTVTGRKHFLC